MTERETRDYSHEVRKHDSLALRLVFAGLGAAFGLEYFDHSFREEAAIENALKLPVLSTIPKIMTEEDERITRTRDRKIFTFAGAYLVIIVIVFSVEFLHRYMGIKVINF